MHGEADVHGTVQVRGGFGLEQGTRRCRCLSCDYYKHRI